MTKPPKTTFYLIRHAETSWNALGKAQGQRDIPLNENGLLQAQAAALSFYEAYPDISHFYSSDLQRAATTAQILSEPFSLGVTHLSSLREKHLGVGEGLTKKEREALYGAAKQLLDLQYPVKTDRWKVSEIPGSETGEEVFQRFSSTLTSLGKTHFGEKVAIVTHGFLLRMFLARIQNIEEELIPHLSNCTVIEIAYTQDIEHIFQVMKISHPLERESTTR